MASALEFLQGDGSETAKPTAKAFLQGSIDEQNLGPQSAKAFLLGDARANQSTEKPGFLSSVVEGMANLGRADASSMSALGRKGAGMGRIGEDLQATFNRAEEKYNIPAGLLARVANTESRFNTSAVSNKGARGIMQFMPDTAKQYGIDPMDPQQAIDAGGQHMRYLLDRYGSDESKALAAYNWGEGNLDKALKKDGDWRSHLPQETYDYLINTQGAKAAGIPDELRGLPVNPTKVDQVRKLYDAMQADDRAALLARDDVDGRVARAVDAQYQRADNTALGRSPLRAVTSGRLEDRALGYRLQGVEPGTALSLASSDVAANMGPQTLATATGEAKPMDFSSEAVQATRRGVVNLKQIGAGLGAWASDVLNDKGAVDGFMQDYKDLSDEAGRLPASVDNLKDIHGGSDLARWAVNAIYANLPMMLPSLAAGGASGLLARSAAKRAFAGLAAEYGEQKAAQMVASRIATAAAGGAGASSVGMETGSIYGDIQQQTGEGHPGLALAAGVPAGILDVLPDMMILKKALGPAAARQVAGGLVARFGAPVAKQMMAEGVTEGAQEAIERGAAAIASGKPFLTQENRDGIIEAMAQGAVAGGVLGGASETLSGEQGNAEKTHGENNINAVGLAGEPGGTGVVAVGPTGRNGVQPDAQPVGITGRPAVESPARSNEPNEPLDPDSIFGRAGAPLPVVTAQGRTKIDRDKPIKPLGDDETLLSAIAKLGGIDAEEAQAQGVDTPYIKGPEAIRGHGIFKVFTKSGRTFDGMAEALRQYGFQVHGANELLAQVTDAIGAQERGQASDLEKFAAEQDDTDYQMEQARKRHADLSPGFEFTEDEYAPEMDPTGRHIHELTTALNRLEDGAGDAILEREAIAGHDNQHTIETLNREITARDRTGESQGEQGQGTRPIAPAEGRGIQVHRMGTGAEGEDTLAKETETAKRKWRMLGQRKREMLLKLDNQPMELANKLFEDLPDDYRKLLTEAEIDHRPETKAATMPGQVDPETGELFSKGGNHEHINAEIYDNAGKTYSGISEDGAGSGLLRGYSISRKEAEQLEKAGVLDIFRVASKGPETTGLQGWFLKNSANSSYVTRKNLITGERLYKNEDWQTIDRQLQDIKKDKIVYSLIS